MKKVLLVIVIFVIAFFINSGKMQNTKNKLNNEIINENKETNNIGQIETEPIKQEKTLDGKQVAMLGDSLIEGYGNEFKGFDYYLSQKLPNTIFKNFSKSGSTITDNSGTDDIIMINQVENLKKSGEINPDIILLDGGANDIMGYSLGFLNNDLKKEIGNVDMNSKTVSNGDTVINDLEEVIAKLQTYFPNAKLCYIQPFLLDNETIYHLTDNTTAQQEIQLRRDTFYTEVQKMCIKWNIEYLDISNYFSGTGTTYRQDDWIHIKHEGYELLTPYILDKLKEI